jgi:8-oxo-dGTP pyrophosphatase MutT (NUDIX family)
VIPVTPDGRIVCVRQFRHGIDAVTLEIPGGVMDPDDPSPMATARREMREETGHDAESFVELGSVTPNPALFNNRCWTYLALNAHPRGAQALDGTEDIEVVYIHPADVPGLVAAGEISHALVVAAFYLYEQYRRAHPDPALDNGR